MQLPIIQTDDPELRMMQDRWKSALDPVLAMPIAGGLILQNVTLASGSNTVNHLLGRKLRGWFPVRWHGAWQQIYDNQDTNNFQDKVLVLVSGGAVTVDLMVF